MASHLDQAIATLINLVDNIEKDKPWIALENLTQRLHDLDSKFSCSAEDIRAKTADLEENSFQIDQASALMDEEIENSDGNSSYGSDSDSDSDSDSSSSTRSFFGSGSTLDALRKVEEDLDCSGLGTLAVDNLEPVTKDFQALFKELRDDITKLSAIKVPDPLDPSACEAYAMKLDDDSILSGTFSRLEEVERLMVEGLELRRLIVEGNEEIRKNIQSAYTETEWYDSFEVSDATYNARWQAQSIVDDALEGFEEVESLLKEADDLLEACRKDMGEFVQRIEELMAAGDGVKDIVREWR